MKKEKIVKYLKTIIICVTIISILVLVILLCLLKNINPEETDLFPPCFVYKLTGFKCAGCGITRATHQILNLNFKEAFCLNPLIFIYAILSFYILTKAVILKVQKKDVTNILKKDIKIILYLVLFVTLFFMVIRNIINI